MSLWGGVRFRRQLGKQQLEESHLEKFFPTASQSSGGLNFGLGTEGHVGKGEQSDDERSDSEGRVEK